jgi:glutathione S-transferase
MSPSGFVPVLVDSTSPGEGAAEEPALVVSESIAILNFLGDAHGGGKGFVPAAGTRLRATYDQWCAYVLIELEKPMWRIVLPTMSKTALPVEVQALEVAHWSRHIAVAAQRLDANGSGYLVGGDFTFADLLLAHVASWAVKFCGDTLEMPAQVCSSFKQFQHLFSIKLRIH